MTFVGIDIGKNKHVAAIIKNKESLDEARIIEISNSVKGRKELINQLKEFGQCEISLEQYGGWASPLDRKLVNSSHTVYTIHPTRLAQAKEMYGQPDKTDVSDALFLAQLLRQSKQGLLSGLIEKSIKKVLEKEKIYEQIKQTERHYLRVSKEYQRTKNRLTQKTSCFLPNLKQVFKLIDGKACLALLSNQPCPSKWKKTHSHTIANWFKKATHNRVGYKRVKRLKQFINQIEWEKLPFEIEQEIKHLAQQLSLLKSQKEELTKTEKQLLDQVPEGRILTSLPGCGVKLSAIIIGELMPIARFPSHNQLARYVGMTRIKKESGNTSYSKSIKLVNKKAKFAFRQLTMINRRYFKPSQEYCQRKEKEGKSKYKATLALGRQLVKVVYAMLRDQKEFDLNLV